MLTSKKLISISFIVLFLSLNIKNSFSEEIKLNNENISEIMDDLDDFTILKYIKEVLFLKI